MARPSGDSEQKLIAAGRKLAAEKGFSAFRVREIAAVAGVNPGMFHYHFKTKQEFMRRVMKEIYGEFLRDFKTSVAGTGTPPERLENAIFRLAVFAHKNRALLNAVLAELVAEPKTTARELRENFFHHIPLLREIVRECMEKGYIKKGLKPQQVVVIIIGAVLPGILFGIVERSGTKTFFDMPVDGFGELLFSETGIRVRLKLVLSAITAEGGGK